MNNDETAVQPSEDVPAPVETAATDVDTTQPTQPELESGDNLDNLEDDDPFAELENTEVGLPEDAIEESTVEAPAEQKPQPEQQATDTTEPARGRETRLEQLDKEISDLRSKLEGQPNAEVRGRVAERNLLQKTLENDIKTQALQLEQNLLGMVNPDSGENYTPTEAAAMARASAIEAESQSLQQQTRNLTIERNQTQIKGEIGSAMSRFPMFQETLPDGKKNPAFNEVAANLAGERLFDAYITEPVLDDKGQPVLDKDGQAVSKIVGIKRSPIDILKSVATTVENSRKVAEANAAQNLSRQSANADVPLNNTNSASRKDPDFEDFDEIMNEDY